MTIRSIMPVFVAAALGAGAARAAGPYQNVGDVESREGNLVRREITVSAGAHPLDRFKVVRLSRDVPPGRLHGSILLLPPFGYSFTFYEQRDANGTPGSAIAEYLAQRYFDVYGYSPRSAGIPSGACESGLLDCSIMATWDLQSMVDDVAYVRAQIESLHPGTGLATGGGGLGGMLALAVANAAPGDHDGIIVWEGMLSSQEPSVIATNQGYCAALAAQIAAGVAFETMNLNLAKEVGKLARLVPSGLTPIPFFPPNLSNHRLMVLLHAVPSPGPLTMPVPGYVALSGSLAEDRLFFAEEARLFESQSRLDSYVPLAAARDVSCSLAGVETAYTSNLGDYPGSVLAIAGGHGFGPYMADSLETLSSASQTLLLEPDFGGLDHFMTDRHREFVERPISDWAATLFGR